jgi:5-methylcytosine-specific restriction endonuclease McrA
MSTRTLLLTPWYFPIKVLRWEDAIKMLFEGTVDVVAEYEETVSSPSVTIRVPSVLRLRKLAHTQRRAVRFSRSNVYLRDGYCCQYCGKKKPARELSYDHVVPRSAGGRTIWTNIVTACRKCNTKKDSQTCDEAGMWPLNTPAQPRWLPMAAPRIDPNEAPEEWMVFISQAS